jgi:hypothetical protein
VTITFPDLSHHKQVSLSSACALITKASQGSGFVDPSYGSYRAAAQLMGIPFAGFHWVDLGELDAQAANAYRVMGSTPCMWDAEAAGATVPRIVELTRRYRALGGRPWGVYLPRWWWRDHLGSPDLRPLVVDAGLVLVSSEYPNTGYTDDGPGWAPYGGVKPTIWQWTDRQPFNGALVDFNAFRGTVAELRALFTGLHATQEVTMFTAQIAGNPACWISNGLRCRAIADPLTLSRFAQAGAHHFVVANQSELDRLCGRRDDVGPEPVTLNPDQLAAIEDAAAMGAGKLSGAGVADELARRLAQ